LIAPVYVVRGNNDKEWAEHLPKTLHVQYKRYYKSEPPSPQRACGQNLGPNLMVRRMSYVFPNGSQESSRIVYKVKLQ
jgi:hypothetical protein